MPESAERSATGAEVVLDVLRTEGARHLFGNPGSTEQPLMEALADADDLEFVLALQEASVVGVAEGYARATRRPSFVNLHTAAGTGNAIGALTNASANGTPLVVTAGQQHQDHLIGDPLLSGDLVGLARPVAKWAHEIRRPDDVGVVLRRAFTDASTAPCGPVFVSLPMDVLERPAAPAPPRGDVDRETTAPRLDELAQALAAVVPGELALVAGDEVAYEDAVPALVDLAEALGAPVHAASMHAAAVFPQDHPLFADTFTPTSAGIAAALRRFKCVLTVGSHVFLAYHYTDCAAVPDDVELLQITSNPTSLARHGAPRLAVLGGLRRTLEALVPLVRARTDVDAARTSTLRLGAARASFVDSMEAKAHACYDAQPAHPVAVAHALVRGVSACTPIVDEAITAGYYLRRYIREWGPNRYWFNRGGGLGWAMPFSVGLSLGLGNEPVLCAVGDGSTMYSTQALWTAARLGTPVVFTIFNNRQYLILKNNIRSASSRNGTPRRFVGMDLDRPAIDFSGLARSLGVPATLVCRPADISDAVSAALAAGGPHVIEVPVAVPE